MNQVAHLRPATPLATTVANTAAFDRELPLVETALTLVGSGTAPRITLVGLNGGLRLARLARDLGARAGLQVTARSHGESQLTGDPRFDLIVEKYG